MKRVLSATAFTVALTVAAPGWSAATIHPLGGPCYLESAPRRRPQSLNRRRLIFPRFGGHRCRLSSQEDGVR